MLTLSLSLQARDPFVQAAKRTPVDLRDWACGMMERDNRKSHLAPQLSPATQDLLRSTDSPTFFNQTITAAGDDRTMQTPTSGEIPIMGTIGSSRDQYSGIHRLPERSANRSPPPAAAARGSAGEAAAGSERAGRAGGSPVHPGMGPRVSTTGSIPQQQHHHHHQQQHQQRTRETVVSLGGPRSAGRVPATFTLPVRPGGSSASARPPPPPRKETAEERREGSRRQATFSPPAEGGYGYGSHARQ